MGLLHTLTRSISTPTIAVHFDFDVMRLMQVSVQQGTPVLQNAFEVSRDDACGLKEAISSFHGNRCALCVPSSDVLVQHIRVGCDATNEEIKHKLSTQDSQWSHAEMRSLCVSPSHSSGAHKQEVLCLGIDQAVSMQHVQTLESAGGVVDSVTVPVYASIRAFDKLYRRDGDEKITSMLIDFNQNDSMIMIAHGQNCVFAHRFGVVPTSTPQEWDTPEALQQIPPPMNDEFERRADQDPRGLHGVSSIEESMGHQLEQELQNCLQHHDALFPQRAIDRIIFSGAGANDTDACASIASQVGIAGYIADPTAWVEGETDAVRGPAWTSAAGTCLKYSEKAA